MQRLDVSNGRFPVPVRVGVGEQLDIPPENAPDQANPLDVIRAAGFHFEVFESDEKELFLIEAAPKGPLPVPEECKRSISMPWLELLLLND